MTTLAERPNRALLVIDVQRGVVDWTPDRDRVVANVAALVDGARGAGVPVVWVQHNEAEMPVGSDYWQIVPELEPRGDEARIDKQYRSSFEATGLEEALADLAVGHVIVCGAETNYCIRHTIHSALERGYDVTLVGDAHAALDGSWESRAVPAQVIIDEQNRSCADYDLPGRRCDLTVAAAAFA